MWQQIKIGRRVGVGSKPIVSRNRASSRRFVRVQQTRSKKVPDESSAWKLLTASSPPLPLGHTLARTGGCSDLPFRKYTSPEGGLRKAVCARKQRGGRWWNSYGGIMDGLGWYGKHEAVLHKAVSFLREFAEFSPLEGCLFSGGLFRTWNV